MIREPGDGVDGEPFAHEPAPPAPRQLIPDRGGFVRGLAMLAMAAASLAGAVAGIQKLGWLVSPLAVLLSVSGLLLAWAAAIHLTGGEKFDDHPWV